MVEKRSRQDAWDGFLAAKSITDKIHVRNLEATVNAGFDVWGRKRKQRALITITLSLAKPFDSAAEADALDRSTVHYGTLSKDIQSCIQEQRQWMSTGDLSRLILTCIGKTAGTTELAATEVDIMYPKSSMLGDGAGYSFSSMPVPSHQQIWISNVLYLRNVRIPCLIGVNSNERTAKQPVVVNMWIECLRPTRTDDYVKLEAVVVKVGFISPHGNLAYRYQVISDSSFETLESLSTKVVSELRDEFFTKEDEDSYVRLQVEKPLAVPFADAPAIEILRRVKA
ncbi:hypothetical protein K458DRAFT_425187 [Lentithecium fluviatile CBS 122367]|uniref:dihydroneopterin aldolase n=1 Tax=Lentithecium fluviatile CBS 122367 TaxID=1168545 RepID=A0A6G1ICE0_9PLEO|nr:hypothetical protein K458DRAFT_425187 [Lentithecium fluviatile CBS 122367]